MPLPVFSIEDVHSLRDVLRLELDDDVVRQGAGMDRGDPAENLAQAAIRWFIAYQDEHDS
ncbi:MAG TPA: hypothetical protein VNS19_21645 [Acidimicrobiales bacterium]|nr:hypothetical protein [Acidimicrobiales bacterium]